MLLPQLEGRSNPAIVAPTSISILETSSDNTCDDLNNCRTLWSIVWSCLATIFACTWVVIHPNIPPLHESWFGRHGRRIVTTIVAIIAPELVICWAAKQYLASMRLAQKYKDFGWTQTHAFFLIMGGFVIYQEEEPVQVVGMRHLRRATARHPENQPSSNPVMSRRLVTGRDYEVDLSMQRLEAPVARSFNKVLVWADTGRGEDATGPLETLTCPMPHITREEITDKSKGDGLSKALAILQTSWFILQCVARGIQRLQVTELELATCAFAVLNGVTYGLWWNKPQSVDYPVPIGRTTTAPSQYDEPMPRTVNGKLARDYRRDPFTLLEAMFTIAWGESFESSSGLFWPLLLLPLSPFLRMMRGTEVKAGDTYVGTYYGGSLDYDFEKAVVQLILVTSSTVFGAIHCIGWSFEFPSRLAQLLWRSCSLVITCFPLIEFGSWIAIPKRETVTQTAPDISTPWSLLGAVAMLVALLLYIAARVVLLVLAVTALISLPHGAYETVSWTYLIPHI
ncbi:hypothetical protein NEOLEDRAFT_1199558 [Neolentinus lepideus HHB14362 ss-1]|uniref:Uncharacterized protein n=1 Tax=Neolentinus lepideus HHB14362 ss-1 TaxID=1314782 RepID=A0A165SZV0_9AGAM|nr:hypothetical protein NEOLEDRAFT_1199558 [Neolentinus lepideus HHB14362 ss-1]